MKVRGVLIAFVIGALLTVSVPVVAHHIIEPQEPIQNVELKIYEYGNRTLDLFVAYNVATGVTTQSNCDGNTVVGFDSLRVETFAGVERDTGNVNRSNPSEHIDAKLSYFVERPNGNLGLEWQVFTRHANKPPHQPVFWESSQNTQYVGNYTGLTAKFEWKVNTLESDQQYIVTCIFEIG